MTAETDFAFARRTRSQCFQFVRDKAQETNHLQHFDPLSVFVILTVIITYCIVP